MNNYKVLFESYNTVFQNIAGGVQNKIICLKNALSELNVDVKLYNKWEDKISDYDLIHIFKINIENFNLSLYAEKKGKPIIVSTILPSQESFLNKIKIKARHLQPFHTGYDIYAQILKIARFIIVESKLEAEYIKDMYKISHCKLAIIPNGINIAKTSFDKDMIFKYLGEKKQYVLYIGRFDANKNQLNLIKAMNDTNIPLVLIGGPDPNNSSYYENCKRIANNNVIFFNWINNEDPLLWSAIYHSKVAVLPSLSETFGISIIESGVFGANMVISKDLPINEWLKNIEYERVDPKSTLDIKNKILIAFNKQKNIKQEKALCNLFSWTSIATQHIEIYKKVVCQKKLI